MEYPPNVKLPALPISSQYISPADMSRLHEYQVIGRKLPTENDSVPKLYRMRIFAPNTQVAKSRFWYFLKQARKVKKASGEIITVNEVITSSLLLLGCIRY